MQNLGIVLYTRGKYKPLKKCLRNLISYDNIFVVSDSKLENNSLNVEFSEVNHPKSICYNHGIRHFLNNDKIDYILLLDEVICILDDDIINKSIAILEQTKISCVILPDTKNKRLSLELKDNHKMSLSSVFDGSFCLIPKSTFEKVGFLDERYKHSCEIVDFYKRCGDKGINTPFGWFAGVENSEKYIEIQYSNNLTQNEIEDDIIRSMKVFYLKYKTQMADLINTFSKKDVISKLKLISSRN